MLSLTEDLELHPYEFTNYHTLPEDVLVQPYEHLVVSGNIMTYQALSSQVPGSLSFDKSIHTSLASIAQSPYVSEQQLCCNGVQTRFTDSMEQWDGEPLQAILPSIEGSGEQANRLSSRRQLRLGSTSSKSSPTAAAAESPKLKKRDRQFKKQSIGGADSTAQRPELDHDKLPINPSRRRIRESNRVAAKKSRLRKRDQVSALVCRERAMEDKNRYLASCFDSLTSDVYHLKMALLQHTHCDCILIQSYITHEARKSVGNLLACSSSLDAYGGHMSPEDLDQAGPTPSTL